MGVIGHWRRSALGAGGVALLLPIGLALGVALTTAFGGRDGLHALAQVFSGPSTPAFGGRAAAPGLESARAVPPIPLPPHVRAARRPGAAIVRSRPTRTPARANRAPAARHPAARRPARHPSGGGGRPQPKQPQPPPPKQHTAVHDAGQQAADQVETLPPPAGQAAGDAVQTVVDLIP